MLGARRYVVVSVLAVLASLAAVAGASPATASACGNGQVLKSGSYVFALWIGPEEKMWTMAQAKANHPTSGEVMISGAMSDHMGEMNMAGSQRHLEVQICTVAGKVVAGAHPSIVVKDTTTGGMPAKVPVAVMEGVGEGAADLHYGNNVGLASGHHISVTVGLGSRHVVFRTVVPKTTMMG